MNSYNIFARYYDLLTENVDYDAGFNFISGFLNEIGAKTVIDLACGTGKMSEKLINNGYSLTCIDASDEMLSLAENRLFNAGGKYVLINAKMQDFALCEPQDACICCLDSINHLTDKKDVLKAFENVYASLNNFGVFIFDVNTVYKHKTALNNQTYVFDEDDFYLVWDNEVLGNERVRIILDFFIENENGLYERYSEEFEERAYSEELLTEMLEKAGFREIDIYGDFNKSRPTNTDERFYFVCRK